MAGLVAAAAVLVVCAVILAITRDPDAAPPLATPLATPTPTPTPSANFESPGPQDHPIALADVGGGLVLATLDQVDRPGTATLWRWDASEWHKIGTLEDATPLHLERDSAGTYLSPGPGSQDVIATSSVIDGVKFSPDGGVTWRHLAKPRPCRAGCSIGPYGDYFYTNGINHWTTLRRAALGTTTWVERSLPPSSGPARG